MLSVMTVQIITLVQTLTNNGIAFSQGILKFSSYSRDGVVETDLSYEAYGSAAVEIMNAVTHKYGVAIGYMDSVNKLPVFKIQTFIPSSLPIASADFEEDPATVSIA